MNAIILDLVIGMYAELILMRNKMEAETAAANGWSTEKSEANWGERLAEARKDILANIAANHLAENSADSIINNLLTPKDDKL